MTREQLKLLGTLSGALSAAIWEIQWWIEHEREQDEPMTGPLQRALETRRKLLSAFETMEKSGLPIKAPEEIMRDANRSATQQGAGEGKA